MPVLGRLGAFAEEVANMADDDEDDVGDVGGEQDVVWRVDLDVALDGLALGVRGRVAVRVVRAVAELGVHGRERLFRVGRNDGQTEPVHVVLQEQGFVQNRVF